MFVLKFYALKMTLSQELVNIFSIKQLQFSGKFAIFYTCCAKELSSRRNIAGF